MAATGSVNRFALALLRLPSDGGPDAQGSAVQYAVYSIVTASGMQAKSAASLTAAPVLDLLFVQE